VTSFATLLDSLTGMSVDQCKAACAGRSECVGIGYGVASGTRANDCVLHSGRCDVSTNTNWDIYEIPGRYRGRHPPPIPILRVAKEYAVNMCHLLTATN